MKTVSLRLADREYELLVAIAQDLGMRPSRMALDIFRLGVQHLKLDNHKVWDKFMREALTRRLGEGKEAFQALVDALSAPQERCQGSAMCPLPKGHGGPCMSRKALPPGGG